MWFQKQLTLPAYPRGFHLITDHVSAAVPQVSDVDMGWLQIFIRHTSASVTINENADPDVRSDMEMACNRLCPESWPYQHSCEGPDDMPAHVKASLLGSSLLIPIASGQLSLGTWQGIYLCEHRNQAGRRTLLLTGCGQARA